jgi:hypothetical protein
MRHNDHFRIFFDGFPEQIRVNGTPGIARDMRYFYTALFFQPEKRAQHGIMLTDSRNDMIAVFQAA